MKHYFKHLLSFMVCLVLITGCGPQRENIRIKRSILSKPASVVILQIGEVNPVIEKGLVELLVNYCLSNEQDIKRLTHEAVVNNYQKEFSKTFRSNGMKVTIVETPLNPKNLIKTHENALGLSPYDLTMLKSQYNCDYAIVFEPIMSGIREQHHQYFSISTAHSTCRIYFVDLKNNNLEGYYYSSVNKGFSSKDIQEVLTLLRQQLIEGHIYLTKF
ncbi:MAG: hypothetical protein KBD31_00445 [Proteobacteria bacterium]|nr:hypothetical protein [Pseudomonadota bacterium]